MSGLKKMADSPTLQRISRGVGVVIGIAFLAAVTLLLIGAIVAIGRKGIELIIG